MEGWRGDPSVIPGLPTGVVRTHQWSGCPIPPGGGAPSSSGSSLKASDPRQLRAWPSRRRRVPGARRLPAGGATSRASPPHISRHFGGSSCASGPNRVSRLRLAHCSLQARRRAGGADWGAAAGSARPPAPPGLGGRLQRGCAPDSFTRAESTSGGTDERVQVRAGAWAGASPGLGEGSSVHGTPGHPWATRVLSAGARGYESPELVALEWRAGRGLRRITGKPGERLFLSCARCSDAARPSPTLGFGLCFCVCSASPPGAVVLGRWELVRHPSPRGQLRSLVTFHPKLGLCVFVCRCAAMAAGKVSVWS